MFLAMLHRSNYILMPFLAILAILETVVVVWFLVGFIHFGIQKAFGYADTGLPINRLQIEKDMTFYTDDLDFVRKRSIRYEITPLNTQEFLGRQHFEFDKRDGATTEKIELEYREKELLNKR